MKANVRKSFNSLPKKEQEILTDYMEEVCNQKIDEREVSLFVQYTKLACFILHNYLELDEQQITSFIGDFKAMRRKYRKVATATELEKLMDVEMAKIFKNGFPTDFVADLQRDK